MGELRSAEVAKLMLSKSGSAFGDSFTGGHDSVGEDLSVSHQVCLLLGSKITAS